MKKHSNAPLALKPSDPELLNTLARARVRYVEFEGIDGGRRLIFSVKSLGHDWVDICGLGGGKVDIRPHMRGKLTTYKRRTPFKMLTIQPMKVATSRPIRITFLGQLVQVDEPNPTLARL